MDIIRAGRGLSKTIRNVGRLQEIVRVFARHGFDEFVSGNPKKGTRITEELQNKSEKDWNQVLGFRLRKCFEELGPAFIKFGQLLSTREDIFHHSFIDEMKLLRDQVVPIPLSDAIDVIERALKKKVNEVFSSIEEKAIGTASIGVVFKATLLDGTPVVIKVRRPGIEKEIENDFSILFFLANQVEKVSTDLKYLGISRIVNDFSASLYRELNLNFEAINAERIKKNLELHDAKKYFYIPKVYKEYSSEEVLVLEFLKGTPFSKSDEILKNKDDVIMKMEYGVGLFLKTFLQDGFFHADLHGGNFFYLEDQRIGLIDFGLMGNLGKKARHHFIAIIYALLSYNYENVVYEFLEVAEYEGIPNIEALIRDVREGLGPFVGLTIKQTNFSAVLMIVMNTLKKHAIYLPREWYIVFRALMTLDGAGKSLGMDFNIYGVLDESIKDIIESTFNKDELMEEMAWGARDLTSSMRMFPRHFRWFLREFAKKGYAIEVINKGHEKEFHLIASSLMFVGFAFISAILALSGVLILNGVIIKSWQDIPTVSWIFWSCSLVLFSAGASLIRKQ